MGTEFDVLIGQLTNSHPAIKVGQGQTSAQVTPPADVTDQGTERDENKGLPPHLATGFLSPRVEEAMSVNSLDQGSQPGHAQREASLPVVDSVGSSDLDVLEPEMRVEVRPMALASAPTAVIALTPKPDEDNQDDPDDNDNPEPEETPPENPNPTPEEE